MRREPAGRLHAGLTSLAGTVDLRGRRLPSRVLFGPHETNLGDAARTLTDRHVAYYARRAAGGAGLIVTETASVHASDHPYAYAPAAFPAATRTSGNGRSPGPAPVRREAGAEVPAADGWAAVAEACHPFGTVVLAGLGHAGGQGSTAHTRTALWGPSRVPDVVTGEVPVPMGRPEIDALVAGFAASARSATAAGLDGVEVNAGQHALLRQFCSGLTNHRADGYGTDRSRLLREVLTAVRDALGPDPVLGLRLCVDELAPWAGITPTDGTALALEVAGTVDYLVPVRGSALSTAATRPDMHTPPGFNRDLCARVRAAVRGAAGGLDGAAPLVLQGSVVDPAMAATALADGTADLVEMTRAQIADPDLVALVRAGTPERVRPCPLSNQGAARDPRNPVVGDEVEPRSGHETTDPRPDGRDGVSRDVLVVGGGPAGCEAARTLALRGHRVTMHDAGPRLGGALRAAATLPGRSRWDVLADWWAAELARLGVDVRTRSTVTAADLTAAGTAGTAVLLATGSRPPEAGIDSDGPVVPAAEFVALLAGAAAGRRGSTEPGRGSAGAPAGVGVVGPAPGGGSAEPGTGSGSAGPGSAGDPPGPDAGVAPRTVVVSDPTGDWTGTGVAELVAASGAACVLVTPHPVAADRLGRSGGTAAANGRLDRAGVERIPFSRVERVRDGRAAVRDEHTGATRTVPCDLLVDCSARVPDRALGGTWRRIGDCVAPRTVAEAVREGRRAALDLSAPPHPPTLEGRRATRPDPVPTATPDPRTGDGGRPGVWTPVRIGSRRLRNRIVFTAHLTGFADGGLPSERHAAYYAARAAGGAAMVITEEHSVLPDDRPYERLIRGHDPAVVPGYRRLTGAVHAHGAVVLAQLNHNGGQSSGMYSRRPVRAPSALPDPMFGEVAVAMDDRDVAEVVDGFARTAAHCVAGGFDGVELQCSQASLLRMFLSPATNRRTDQYGGSPAGRARIVVDVLTAVREVLGPDRILGIRIGADERIPGGIDPDDAIGLARLLAGTGLVDHLNTTVGVATASLHLVEPSMHTPRGYASPLASAIRSAVWVPVIGVGRFTTPADAHAALAAGDCDLVGVARGQIADPEFAARAADGRPVRTCVGCNQECVGRVGQNLALGCAVNPRAGREWLPPPGPVRRGLRVAVVGAGPAGLAAAASLAGRGHRVTLYERDRGTGGQLALAALAPGRDELGTVVRDLTAACARLGVRPRTGTDVRDATDLAPDGRAPDAVVLATGSVPSTPTWVVPGVGSVHDVLAGRTAPRGRVLVVDELGFHQATSVAELLALRGADVEIVSPALVAGQDLGTTLDREGFRRRAHGAGIATSTDRVVLRVDGSPGRLDVELLHHPTGRIEHRRVAAVVAAVPTTPRDDLWTTLDGQLPVHRIGDCLAPRRMDAAIREGDAVAVAVEASGGVRPGAPPGS